jgi:pyridoxamine 5'-phosphate oxidase
MRRTRTSRVAHAEAELRFAGADVSRPPYWTGYRIRPDRIEFWVDQPDRLHERNLYTRTDTGYTVSLLSP